MEKKTLGAFIAILRKEKSLTQKQLAELLNVSDKTVSHWECDETSPDISVLPQLAEILGVSVDELLRGEKKSVEPATSPYIPPRQEGFATRTINKIKSRMTGDITERYRYFRILSLIGTIIPCVVLLIEALTNSIAGYYFMNEMAFIPGIVALIGSLWTLAIALGLTLGARLAFSKGTFPSRDATEEEKKYVYKANSFCFNNLFLIFSTLPMALTGIDALDISAALNVPTAVVGLALLWLILFVVLNKKGILRTEKRKMLTLKYLCAFVSSALIVTLSLILFRESYIPNLEYIIFDNSAEFIAYMETPADKPGDAYLIDGVEASTFPPTIMLTPGRNDAADSPVRTLPSEDAGDVIGETVMGYCGEDYVTFKWLNKAVYDFIYLEEQGTFRVITYEAKIKQKDMWILVDDGVPIAIVMFCVVDSITCFALYKRKVKILTEE